MLMKWVDGSEIGAKLNLVQNTSGAHLFVFTVQDKLEGKDHQKLLKAGFIFDDKTYTSICSWRSADALRSLKGVKIVDISPEQIGYSPPARPGIPTPTDKDSWDVLIEALPTMTEPLRSGVRNTILAVRDKMSAAEDGRLKETNDLIKRTEAKLNRLAELVEAVKKNQESGAGTAEFRTAYSDALNYIEKIKTELGLSDPISAQEIPPQSKKLGVNIYGTTVMQDQKGRYFIEPTAGGRVDRKRPPEGLGLSDLYQDGTLHGFLTEEEYHGFDRQQRILGVKPMDIINDKLPEPIVRYLPESLAPAFEVQLKNADERLQDQDETSILVAPFYLRNLWSYRSKLVSKAKNALFAEHKALRGIEKQGVETAIAQLRELLDIDIKATQFQPFSIADLPAGQEATFTWRGTRMTHVHQVGGVTVGVVHTSEESPRPSYFLAIIPQDKSTDESAQENSFHGTGMTPAEAVEHAKNQYAMALMREDDFKNRVYAPEELPFLQHRLKLLAETRNIQVPVQLTNTQIIHRILEAQSQAKLSPGGQRIVPEQPSTLEPHLLMSDIRGTQFTVETASSLRESERIKNAQAVVDRFTSVLKTEVIDHETAENLNSRVGQRKQLVKEVIDSYAKACPDLSLDQVLDAYMVLDDVKDPPKDLVGATLFFSLFRRAYDHDQAFTSYAATVLKNYSAWKAENGAKYNPEAQLFLDMACQLIACSFHIARDDFEHPPFYQQGGLGKMWELVGDGLDDLLTELNGVLNMGPGEWRESSRRQEATLKEKEEIRGPSNNENQTRTEEPGRTAGTVRTNGPGHVERKLSGESQRDGERRNSAGFSGDSARANRESDRRSNARDGERTNDNAGVFGTPETKGNITAAGRDGRPGRIPEELSEKRRPRAKLNPQHFFLGAETQRKAGFSPKKRFDENMRAIEILHALEEQGRPPSEEEKTELTKYNGWGGLAKIFDPYAKDDVFSDSWTAERENPWLREGRETLPEILSEEEYRDARASVNNAHYTPPMVVKKIWEAIGQAGFTGGDVLEPGAGVGSFLGLAPKNIVEKSRFTAIEKEPIAGGILENLFPDADIRVEGFEKTRLPDMHFDLVVGNVPFGNYTIYDPRFDHLKMPIHDLFIVKSLEALKPGGVMAVITASGTLDKQSDKARRIMHERAHLAGAIRLPDDAFMAQAGTKVTTDILFFVGKHNRRVFVQDPAWVESELAPLPNIKSDHLPSQYLQLNNYFIENPKNALGKLGAGTGSGGITRMACSGEGVNLEERMNDAISRIVPKIIQFANEEKSAAKQSQQTQPSQESSTKEKQFIFDFESRPEGSYILGDDGLVYRVSHGGAKAVETGLSGKKLERVSGMIRLRDALDEVFRTQQKHMAPIDIGDENQEVVEAINNLNLLHDQFIEKFGPVNTNVNRRLFIDDPTCGRVFALESFDEEKGIATKADVFFQRVIASPKDLQSVDTAQEALLVCLDKLGGVSIPVISELCGLPEETCLEQLDGKHIFLDPVSKRYETAAMYLAGNVREKLRQAENASDFNKVYNKNVDALRDVQPEDLGLGDIELRLGAPWIPENVVRDFIVNQLEIDTDRFDVNVDFNRATGQWAVRIPRVSHIRETEILGTPSRPFSELVRRGLNQLTVAVFDTVEERGSRRQILNEKETVNAAQKLEEIQRNFVKFCWEENPERAEQLVRIYNDLFNCHVAPSYDGGHLTLPGLSSAIELRPYQKDAVWRALTSGTTIFGHEVGLGKTMCQVVTAFESKRLGRSSKPLWLVPNHMIEQAEREARQLYPSGRILAVQKDDLKGKRRTEFVGRVANNNWDVVIMTHRLFEQIKTPQKFEEEFMTDELSRLRSEIRQMQENGASWGTKRIEQKVANLEARLERRIDQGKNPDDITIDMLGVDFIIVDESHNFKNLQVEVAANSEVASSGISGSQRAFEMYMKTRWLFQHRGDVSGLVEASGTVVSNNVLEVFNVMRRVMPERLQEAGLSTPTAWAGVFLSPKTTWEPSPSGTGWKLRTRYSLQNIPELMNIFRTSLDVLTADEVGVPRPEMETINVTVDITDDQQEIMEDLAKRVEALQSRSRADLKKDNLLKIVHEGRSLALDPRLLKPWLPAQSGSKTSEVVENVLAEYHWSNGIKGTQLVFCDLGTPGPKKTFDVYSDLKKKLTEKGIPESEVEFIHTPKNDTQKARLFAKVRSGDVRVLIGSTSKMGEGTNVQDLLVAIHHVDAPWRPSDVEQRDGRIRRFGNQNDQVRRYIYTTKDSFDLFMWSTLKYKNQQFSRILRGDSSVRKLDMNMDPTYAETAAITTSNPQIKEKLEVDQQVSKLENLRNAHTDKMHRTRLRLSAKKHDAQEMREHLGRLDKLPAPVHDSKGTWSYQDRDKKILETEHTAFLDKLRKHMKKQKLSGASFSYRGVPVAMSYVHNENGRLMATWSVGEGDDAIPRNNMPNVMDLINNTPEKISRAETRLKNIEGEIEHLTLMLEEGFEHGEELSELYARRSSLMEQIQLSGQAAQTQNANSMTPESVTTNHGPELEEDVENMLTVAACGM